MTNAGRRIGVVGAGFSGTLVTAQLLRQCRPGDRIYLFERGSSFGRGLAYSTENPEHLLNVRASNMGAFPDAPRHFHDWLATRSGERGNAGAEPLHPDSFVARQQYGAYLEDLLRQAISARASEIAVSLVNQRVVDVREGDAGGLLIVIDAGAHEVDAVVLATGNPPPDESTPGYFGDPWAPGAVDGLPPDAPVLLIGTGLTMVDVVLSLLRRGHAGRIHAVSRRGLMPRRHAPVAGGWSIELSARARRSALAACREVRANVDLAARSGVGWRAVIDALRPVTQDLWRGWPLAEKHRFLRHLRPWWDVHRHRMAPSVADAISEAVDRGQLIVEAGRIRIEQERGSAIAVRVKPRGSEVARRLTVDRIINCTGPRSDYSSIRDPLFEALIGRGTVRPDALRLGIDVAESGAVIGRDGQISDRIFALGPVTKGIFWEIVAVPDIRAQCEALAGHILRTLDRRAVRAPEGLPAPR